MKITIETTPTEFAELIFNLVDADFEVDDDDGGTDDDADDAEKDTRDQFIVQLLYKVLEQTNKKAP